MDKLVVAVSGGIDSVVLLDMLVNNVLPISQSPIPNPQLIVAHFDHGIRPESAKDTEFVESLARKYNLPFEAKREELGENASEELARDRRYEFLREVAKKYDAKLVTAHHADDVIESIAINLRRGTGWRGLSVMDSDIHRPLTKMTKSEIVHYAKEHNLEWREDFTNQQSNYLRNQIRTRTMSLDLDSKRQLLALWSQQKELRKLIDDEVIILINGRKQSFDGLMVYDRYFFTNIDIPEAAECLRVITKSLLTRPQSAKALLAIKTYASGKKYQAGSGVTINFITRNFTVELLK